MAQPASSPKIEELRFRLKTDPKSRLFYPLAEELRKIQQHGEAEQVLRLGLTVHPTYLSAWVSLGRVLREQGKNAEAVDPLSRALQLDPGNVVASRALADAYLALGEKVEAIKKYKLVHALLPSDQDVVALIEQLDREINQELPAAPEPEPVPEPAPQPEPGPVAQSEPWSALERGLLPPMPTLETPFGDVGVFAGGAAAGEEQGIHPAAGHVEPSSVAGSPFEEPPVDFGFGGGALGSEPAGGIRIGGDPLAAEIPPLEDQRPPAAEAARIAPEPFVAEPAVEETADFFAPAEEPPPAAPQESYIETGIAADLPFALEATLPPLAPDDFAKTITMADLYAGQGLVDEARDIYEDILARDPSNESVRAKLEALDAAQPQPAVTYEESEYEGEESRASEEMPGAFSMPAIQSAVFEPQEDHSSTAPQPSSEAYEERGEPILPFEGGQEAEPAAVSDFKQEAQTDSRAKIARLERWLSKMGRREVSGDV